MHTIRSFQGESVLELNAGHSVARLSPKHGARLLTWERNGKQLIHWPEDISGHPILKVRGGNPILFPFIARHMVNGEIGKWQNEKGEIFNMPMHGFARQSEFQVMEFSSNSSIRMQLTDSDETRSGYPFSFVFTVEYQLSEDSLTAIFETINTGETPLPYYAGHHFYFPLPHKQRPQWRLSLPAEEWGKQNFDGSIDLTSPTGSVFPMDDPKLIDRMHVQKTPVNVELWNEDKSFHILFDLQGSDTPWYAVTTWTASNDSDFYCVEPWLGLPNAIHHHLGLRWLRPGQKEIATCTIKDLS